MRRRASSLASVPSVPPPQPPAVGGMAAGGPASSETLVVLAERLAALEARVGGAHDDDPIWLPDFAPRLRASVETVRDWLRDPQKVRDYGLDVLFVPAPGGRWFTTRRRIAQWEDSLSRKWAEKLFAPLHLSRRAAAGGGR